MPLTRRQRFVFFFALILVLLHQLTIHAGTWWWLIDIWSHMQMQILIFFILFFTLSARYLRYTPFTIFCILYLLWLGVWVFAGTRWLATADIQAPIDVYYQNVEFQHTPHIQREMGSTLATYPARIFAFAEPSPLLIATVTALLGVAPVLEHDDGGSSCVVFVPDTTLVVRSAEVLESPRRDPICVVHFDAFDLYVVHPLPPLNDRAFKRQKVYFVDLANKIRLSNSKGRPWLVVGDFNSTKYSAVFRHSFETYFDRQQYTWSWPGPLTIPIDHVFGSIPHTIQVYPALSSDHRGIGITF